MNTGVAILAGLCSIFLLIILFSYFNEKVLKLPSEIGLMTTAFGASLIIIIMEACGITQITKLYKGFSGIYLHDIIMNGFLCYLLFSGAARIKFRDLTKDKFLILSLTFFSTFVAAMIYAGITYYISKFVGVNLTFIEACILGSIIAPTDPISAMSILKKAGLSERISIIIEGESLFNDGIAVALYVTFTTIKNSVGVNPTYEFIRSVSYNVLGAILVGLISSWILFLFFRHTKQKYLEVVVSLAAVSIAYTISELIEVSAPTAAVIVGIFFATKMHDIHSDNEIYYSNFYIFWTVIDKILNGFLYILIGFAALFVHRLNHFFIIALSSIALALCCRYLSIVIPIFFFGRSMEMKRENYSKVIRYRVCKAMTTLMTWGGLKGGISIALAIGTVNIFTGGKYHYVVASTYAVVVFSTLIQGLTVGKLYHRIKHNLY